MGNLLLKTRVLLYKKFIRKNISGFKKRKFYQFGEHAFIEKPYLQLSGVDKIAIGDNVTILKDCRLAVYGDTNSESITIGDRCYIGFGFTALSASGGKLVIGNDVLFASNVLVTNEDHGINPESDIPYMDQELTFKDVYIGDGCWIGEKVNILPGVKIGKKSIIGAGAVVTKSIPDYAIAVGNPARVIKQYNFDKQYWEKVQ